MEALAILFGGALGGMARFWLADRAGRRWVSDPLWGILLVNASGALLAGAVAAALTGSQAPGSLAWQLAVPGFLGSYTTVSSFSLQTLALLHDGAIRRAVSNIAASLLLVLGGVALGWSLATWLLGMPV